MSAKQRLANISESMKQAGIEAHAQGMKCIEWYARIDRLCNRASEEEAEAMLMVLRDHGLISVLDIPTL